ncbi:hypothetical protein [Diaphorobacter aerolatus]|uniref:Uncharacterized protein n=1 Tax=Diaphorobacter aerolatus TaxID=1288495 RepID=A0A7H0GLH7_9BURK|nr:hypothetical protein [Diaphorobacter aerolatus]QNP49143.1 hypothetical protein H9K75_03130 [Diaphorobacter aerolatus]
MKPLVVDSSLRALIGGAFYPSGHTMVMYANEAQARDSADKLLADGFTGDDIYFAPPADIISQIAPTVENGDEPLPSAGTDGVTAREFVKLAREGQYGLLIVTKDDEAAERIKRVIAASGYTIARRYHALVIEDF